MIRTNPLDKELDELAALLAPLSNPVRLRVLRYLTKPHRMREIASHLGTTRQAAKKHVDRLISIGLVDTITSGGNGGSGTEFVVNLQILFVIQTQFEKLGSLEMEEGLISKDHTMRQSMDRTGRLLEPGTSLFVVHGKEFGRRFNLDIPDQTRWSIGRDKECEIPLVYDPWASTRHAQIHREGDRFVLTDLGSTNGTRHNWTPLPRGEKRNLKHGDLIGLGQTKLMFSLSQIRGEAKPHTG